MTQFQNIVVVDDSQLDRFIAEKMIQRLDLPATLISKASGIEALDYLNSTGQSQQLVLLDINMPGMDGFEFLDKLPEHTRKNITVVMLTSSIRDDDKAKAQEYSMVRGLIHKPLNTGQLQACLSYASLFPNTHFYGPTYRS